MCRVSQEWKSGVKDWLLDIGYCLLKTLLPLFVFNNQ